MRDRVRQFFVMFDAPGDGGAGGGAGSAAPPSGGATPPAAAPAGPAPSGGGTPPAAAAPPAGTPPVGTPPASRFEYPEDRSAWIPPHRLASVAARAQQAQERAERLQAMIEAGTGVRVGQHREVPPEIQEARQAFSQVFPGLAQLEAKAELLGRILQSVEEGRVDPTMFGRLGDFASDGEHRWQQHGRQQLMTLHAAVAKDYGVDRLTPNQQRVVGTAYQQWLESDQTGERVNRYVGADPALLEEFLNEYRNEFIAPLRRSADAATLGAGRRVAGLPAAPRGAGAPPAPPAAPLSEDEVHSRAFAAFQAANAR